MISGNLTVGKMLNSYYGNLLHSKAVSDPYETGRRGEKGVVPIQSITYRWACDSAVLPKIASLDVAKPGAQSFENGG